MAERPTPFADTADDGGWVPDDLGGHARLRLSPAQQIRWSALTLGVGAVLAITGVAVASAPLLIATAVIVGASLSYGWVAGVELTPATLTVFAPSLRTRTLWARTVRWSTILDIQTTDNGEVWLSMPGEPPLVVRAPRGRWVVPDPDFDEKVRFLIAWWRVHRNASSRGGEEPSLELVRREMGRVGTWVDPGADAWRLPDEAGTARPRYAPVAEGDQVVGGDLFADPVEPDPDALPEDPSEPVPTTSFPIALFVGFVALSLVVGYLFLGPDLIVAVVALLVLLRFGRDPGRPLALGAFVLLVLSALATIVQRRPATVSLSYAQDRSVAVQAGAVIGVFLVVSTVVFALSERSTGAAPRRELWRGLDHVHLKVLEKILPAWLRSSVPYVIVALAGLAIRVAGSPPALPAAYDPLLANIRLGTGYSLAVPSGGVPAGQYPPLAPVLVAFSPLGPRVAMLLVSTLAVVAVGWVAHRRWGRAPGILAAGVAALLPAMWGVTLPVLLAGLGALGAVAFGDPVRLTPQRAAGAGVCAGLAALARPDALVVAVVIGWWIRRQRPEQPSSLVSYSFATVATLIPWLTFVWTEFRSPWPMATLRATLNDPSATQRLPALAALVVSAAVLFGLTTVLIPQWPRRYDLLPYFALPASTVLLAFTSPDTRDLLTWSAPLVAVAIGRWAAPVVRTQLGPVLEVRYRDMLDWDDLVDAEQARLGGPTDRWEDDPNPIGTEPDEDRLFL